MRLLRTAFPKTVQRSVVVTALFGAAVLSGCGDGASPYIPVGGSPVVSPSGGTNPLTNPQKILFASARTPDQTTRLYAMNPDGSNVTLVPGLGTQYNFRLLGDIKISRNGQKILMSFDYGTGTGLQPILANADGTGVVDLLPVLSYTGSGYSLNSDGSKIVYVRGSFVSGATPGIPICNADGSGDAVRLGSTTSTLVYPVFAPDDQTLYFVSSTGGGSGYGIYTLAPGSTTPTALST